MKTPKRAYALLPSEMLDTSRTHVTPIIVTDGESGYNETDWSWIKEHAEEARDHANKKLGLTKEEADKLFVQSMFPKRRQAPAYRDAVAVIGRKVIESMAADDQGREEALFDVIGRLEDDVEDWLTHNEP